MTNPTSNFGWQMPEPTDLVTNLPADFEVFGQAVDTDFADLLGGTTGQVLSKTSATDLDFTWTTPTDQTPLTTKGDLFTFTTTDARIGVGTTGQILSANPATATGLEWVTANPGDITEVTVTSPITGGGSSGSVNVAIQDGTTAQKGAVQLENSTSSTSTTTAAVPANVKTSYDLAAAAIPKSTVTTNGDLIYGTGSATVTRLGIGSTSQVLTVAGGIPSWQTPAGGSSGLNLILTETFTTASSITRDALFSTTYDNYYILMEFTASTTASMNFYLRSSGSNITGGYSRQTLGSSGSTVNAARNLATGEGTVANSLSTGRNYIVFNIASPFLTQNKGFITEALCTYSTVTNERYMNISDSTASCTGIYLFPNSGTITGKVSYYGYGK